MLEAVDIWNLHKILVPTVYDMFLKKFVPDWVISKANSLELYQWKRILLNEYFVAT